MIAIRADKHGRPQVVDITSVGVVAVTATQWAEILRQGDLAHADRVVVPVMAATNFDFLNVNRAGGS